MSYLSELTENLIALFDKHYMRERAAKVRTQNLEGRIIYASMPAELFNLFDDASERIATLREVAQTRIDSYRHLLRIEEVKYGIGAIAMGIFDERVIAGIVINILAEMEKHPEMFAAWKTRITTSTSMVRAGDNENDYLYFHDKLNFHDKHMVSRAFEGKLSDGGIEYYQEDLDRIIKESYSRIPYDEYLELRGGNFTGLEFTNHPVFEMAFGGKTLLSNYVLAMQVLNLVDFYHKGLHSGWLPREMPRGFGRFISLGYKGEAFYPVNSTTRGHEALIVPIDYKIK